MSRNRIHVLVIGGGIGGLGLAQRLRRGGVDVSVHERDRTPTAREQGYRVHIDPTGSRALRECLPPVLWEAFVATAGDPGTAGFGFLDERLRTLVLVEDEIFAGGRTDPAAGHHAVSRITLRQLLLAGLDDVVHFDRELVRFERLGDGRVGAVFADGSTAAGDVLVGADGAGSRLRAQRLPGADRVDTGAVGVGGRLDLSAATRAWLPERLAAGMNVVLGPRDFLFTAVFNRRRRLRDARAMLGDDVRAAGLDPDRLFGHVEDRDYLLWAFVTRRERLPAGEAGAVLQAAVCRMVAAWHPDLRRVIGETDPDTVRAFPFLASVAMHPWPATDVTLIGDAIHSMPPAGGVGANVALRDAAELCRALAAADRGEVPLLEAIGGYEARMRDYCFAAVRTSVTRTREALAGRLSRAGTRSFLRLCGAVPALRRAVFQHRW
jgi:salicylate hydroxylase